MLLMNNAITLLIIILTLSGCRETKSHEWYLSHPQEAYEVLSECFARQDETWNCEFARRAGLDFIQSSSSPDTERRRFQALFTRYEK